MAGRSDDLEPPMEESSEDIPPTDFIQFLLLFIFRTVTLDTPRRMIAVQCRIMMNVTITFIRDFELIMSFITGTERTE